MEVDGFDFAALPEIVKLREHLKQVLGAEYSKKAAAAWSEKHKDEFCPLKEPIHVNSKRVDLNASEQFMWR